MKSGTRVDKKPNIFALPRFWQGYDEVEQKQGHDDGDHFKSGVICIGPLITMAIWLIRALREKRDRDAAKQFFTQAEARVGHAPDHITTDGHRSYPRAIRETMGSAIEHRTSKYLNNCLEQDHRGIKQRYYPMCGFKIFESTARFCCTFDELRHYFRPRHTMGEVLSLLEQRQTFLQRLADLQTVIQTAS